MHPDSPITWRKSTHSGSGGQCVEVADARPVRVRDSKDPDGPRLNFSPASWQAFIIAIRAGEFDGV